MSMDALFDMTDVLSGALPDDQEWREIVAETVDRVVISDGDSSVSWRQEYRALMTLAA